MPRAVAPSPVRADDAAFRAWLSSSTAAAPDAPARACIEPALAAFVKRKGVKLELCAACAAYDSAELHATLAGEAADAARRCALPAWRDAAAPHAAAQAGICGAADARRSRAHAGGRARECALWCTETRGEALEAHAAQSSGAALLQWPSLAAFSASLDAYLSDRLLCKVRGAPGVCSAPRCAGGFPHAYAFACLTPPCFPARTAA